MFKTSDSSKMSEKNLKHIYTNYIIKYIFFKLYSCLVSNLEQIKMTLRTLYNTTDYRLGIYIILHHYFVLKKKKNCY